MKAYDNSTLAATRSGSSRRKFDIDTAVQRACEPSAWDNNGVAERARDAADRAAELLGRLIQKLADKNLLLAEDVQDVVGSRFEIVVED